jgi:hypothetical protein
MSDEEEKFQLGGGSQAVPTLGAPMSLFPGPNPFATLAQQQQHATPTSGGNSIMLQNS